jgi:hypothetical protein
MQTFLPYADFRRSAEVLDNKRLNKQILEGYQILKVLHNPDPRAAWRNHPAVKMWNNHQDALYNYIANMVLEARGRGIKTDKNEANLIELHSKYAMNWESGMPKWYEDSAVLNRLTESHRANLYRKDPEFYVDFMYDNANPCCDKCQYYWITHQERISQ